MIFEYIVWEADPVAFEVFGFAVRWYGLFYAISFLVGHWILSKALKREGLDEKAVDSLAITSIVAVILGGRLGHCLFYHPDYYLPNPIEILKIWEGGMASHGAVIGIIIGLFYYLRRYKQLTFLWVADRLLVPVAFGAFMIRFGNLMNSEIVGDPSNLPWAFKFLNHNNPAYRLDPRHPSQLYEALAYIPLFGFMLWGYFKRRLGEYQGLLSGIFLTYMFTMRILIEFTKTPQEQYQNETIFKTGQWLSIPFLLLGIGVIVYNLRKGRVPIKITGEGKERTEEAR